MLNHPLRRSPAGRGDHLKRLIQPDPGLSPTDIVVGGLPLTAPITVTFQRPATQSIELSPSLSTQPSPADYSSVSFNIPPTVIPSAVPLPASSYSPLPGDATTTITVLAGTQESSSSQALSGPRRLQKGAIAAIVVVVSLVVLSALGVFIVRKFFIHKRMRKRATWTPGFMGKPVSSNDYIYRDSTSSISSATSVEKPRRIPVPSYSPSEFSPATELARASAQPSPILPPPLSYNSSITRSSLLTSTSLASPFSPAGTSQKVATVQYTFIPSLPDELTISTGEMVRVLTEYDDGWALCSNGMGEQGMVPLECLVQSEPGSSTPDGRNSKRMSSLVSPRY